MIQPIDSPSSMIEAMSQMRSASQGDPSVSMKPNDARVEFSDVLHDAVQSINAQQIESSNRAAAVDSGQSDDLVGAMIAGQKASLSFLALAETRNRVLKGFEDLMRMPV